MRSFLPLALPVVFFAALPVAQALAQGTVFQPPEEQRQLGLPDKAAPAPAPAVPTAPLVGGSAPARSPSAAPVETPKAAAAAPAAPSAASIVAGEWTAECLPGKGKLCQAVVRSRIGGQIALVLAIARASVKEPVRMQMALPLGFDVQRGVDVEIGAFKTSLKVSRCTAQGCLVEEEAPKAFIDALVSEAEGKVTVRTVDGNAIEITLPAKNAKKALSASLQG